MKFSDIYDIADEKTKHIFERVGGMTLKSTEADVKPAKNACSFSVKTTGDYCMNIVLHAEYEIFRSVAVNMKRGGVVKDSDINIYITEFFNILCGHIISAINKKYTCSARFGIPDMVKGYYQGGNSGKLQHRKKLTYLCSNAAIELELLFYDDLRFIDKKKPEGCLI